MSMRLISRQPDDDGVARGVDDGRRVLVVVREDREGQRLAVFLDGTGVEDLVTGMIYPYAIAIDMASGKMFWIRQELDSIWRANLDGTKNLIAAAKLHAPEARFVMASTGLVYDADATHPGLEEDATRPTLAQSRSQSCASQNCSRFAPA